jgi:hypothetical protein
MVYLLLVDDDLGELVIFSIADDSDSLVDNNSFQ